MTLTDIMSDEEYDFAMFYKCAALTEKLFS